jgi:hypothetical protein
MYINVEECIVLYYKHSMAPHVLATLVAILKEGYATKAFQPMHKCKTLSFKILF